MLDAAVDNVLLLPANFIVLDNNLLPVASCVNINTALDPARALPNALIVILPVNV
jgi:hypothetical protein